MRQIVSIKGTFLSDKSYNLLGKHNAPKLFAPNGIVSKDIKQKLTELAEEIDKSHK